MTDLQALRQLIAALRDPDTGCPWDAAQTYASLVRHTLEEAFEVADAIDRQQTQELKTELGDLLFQILFYSQLAEEQQQFSFDDVVSGLSAKLIRRHPHVFAGETARDPESLRQSWAQIKAAERQTPPDSRMDFVPAGLEPLLRANKLQQQAASIGFDWPEAEQVLDKCAEELDEIRDALNRDLGADAVAEEVGDLLFCVVNLARHLKVEPNRALRQANLKFARRFRWVEQQQARQPQADLAQMEDWWQEAKAQER